MLLLRFGSLGHVTQNLMKNDQNTSIAAQNLTGLSALVRSCSGAYGSIVYILTRQIINLQILQQYPSISSAALGSA